MPRAGRRFIGRRRVDLLRRPLPINRRSERRSPTRRARQHRGARAGSEIGAPVPGHKARPKRICRSLLGPRHAVSSIKSEALPGASSGHNRPASPARNVCGVLPVSACCSAGGFQPPCGCLQFLRDSPTASFSRSVSASSWRRQSLALGRACQCPAGMDGRWEGRTDQRTTDPAQRSKIFCAF